MLLLPPLVDEPVVAIVAARLSSSLSYWQWAKVLSQLLSVNSQSDSNSVVDGSLESLEQLFADLDLAVLEI